LKATQVEQYFVVNLTKNLPSQKSYVKDNLTVIPTKSPCRLFFLINAFLISRKIIKSNKISLITTQDPYECGLLGLFLKILYGIPLNIQIRSSILNNKKYLKEKLINRVFHFISKRVIRFADTIGVPSQEQIDKLKGLKISEDRLFCVPTILDLNRFSTAKPIDLRGEFKLSKTSKIIMISGRLVKQKNLYETLSLFDKIQASYGDVYFFILGKGPERDGLEDFVKVNNIKNVVFTGEIANKLTPKYYKAADIFILNSLYEGASKSLQEAAASGLPLVSSNTTGAAQIINNSGYITRSDDEFVEKTLFLLNNPEVAKEFGDNGEKFVLKNFSQELKLKNYMDMFRKTRKRKKLLICQKVTGLYGSENHLLHLIGGLKDSYDVHFLVLSDPRIKVPEFEKLLVETGVTIHHMSVKHHISPTLMLKFLYFFIKNRFDIVHTHLIHCDHYATLAAFLTFHKRILSTKHAPIEYKPNGVVGFFERQSIRLQNRVIFISDFLFNLYLTDKMGSKEKFKTILYGIEFENKKVSSIRGEFGIDEDAPLLLMIARFVGFKSHDVIIKAMADVVEKEPKARLILLGEGPLRGEIEAMVKKFNLSENVMMPGYREDTHNFYESCDIYGHTSVGEGFGIVFLEAMNHAKPIIASNHGAIPEIVLDGKTGYLFKPKVSKELSKLILKLLGSEDIKKFGKCGEKRLKEAFRVEAMVQKTMDLYEEL
jgi:glycosyltransferase involved in cell wall biosynthesis